MPFFLPYQLAWIRDDARLKIIEKSRQIGISLADAYDSVRKVCVRGARLDVWVSSRDEAQARLYLEDCKKLAAILQMRAIELGDVVLERKKNISAGVLQFPTGRRIYSLSSNPNALAGKRGHVKLDEFALHQDQRLLYQVAKPVTQWGGQLCVISTHRRSQSVFNELIRDIRERGNPMGWSLHSVPLQKAVEQGLVERINQKTSTTDEHRWTQMGESRLVDGINEETRKDGLPNLQLSTASPARTNIQPVTKAGQTREQFLHRLHAECIDEEQWQQEYCCVPGDDAAAFITYEMITACEDGELRLATFEQLADGLGTREL